MWTILQIVWLITGPMGFAAMMVSTCLHEKISPNRFFEEGVQWLQEDEDLRYFKREFIVAGILMTTALSMFVPFMGWVAFVKDWRNIYHTKKEPSN